MTYQTFWHGSDLPREKLIPGKDGGIHLGSRGQAEARNLSAFLHEVRFDPGRVRRAKDAGGAWAGKIASARSARMTSIVYLNRYEGVPNEYLEASIDHAEASDSVFRKHVPSAENSVIALYAEDVRAINIVPGKGSVTLYHGTTPENAEALLRHGFDPETWRSGGNGGSRGHLYLTDKPENAAWFAEQLGSDTVLRLRVPAADLVVDPEDGIEDTVVKEFLTAARTGLPVTLATRTALEPHNIFRHAVPKRTPECLPEP